MKMNCIARSCEEVAISSGRGICRWSLWLCGLGRVREWKSLAQVGHGNTGQGGWATVVTVEPEDADGSGALFGGKDSRDS